MSEQPHSPDAPADLGESTDISAAEIDVDGDQDKPATSTAEAYRADEDTLGGTGGMDAGGAG